MVHKLTRLTARFTKYIYSLETLSMTLKVFKIYSCIESTQGVGTFVNIATPLQLNFGKLLILLLQSEKCAALTVSN